MQSEGFVLGRFSATRKGLFVMSLLLSAGQVQAQTEVPQGGVTVSVSGGMAPTFSWTPDSAIGRLVVEQGDKELWGTETEGTNTYRSPIRYGVHPPEALEDVPADPLVVGQTYKVSLFRWIRFAEPESLQFMGA